MVAFAVTVSFFNTVVATATSNYWIISHLFRQLDSIKLIKIIFNWPGMLVLTIQ